MSLTLQRLGLWLLVLVLALYVVHEAYAEQTWAEMIPMPMLQKVLVLSLLLLVAGLVMRVVEKGKKKVTKNRCQTCGTVIAPGAIYCREHLRNVLELEDRRTHATKIRLPNTK